MASIAALPSSIARRREVHADGARCRASPRPSPAGCRRRRNHLQHARAHGIGRREAVQDRDRRKPVRMRLRIRVVGVANLVVDGGCHVPWIFHESALHFSHRGRDVVRVARMLTVRCPLNTMLADLDETIRGLLKERTRGATDSRASTSRSTRRSRDGPASSPSRPSALPLRHARGRRRLRTSEWQRREARRARSRAAADGMEASYAVTAWTQAVEDEHRLLSQVLAIFFAYPEIPQDKLNGRLANGSQAWPIKAASARARARSPTSGARSAASTRSRWITSSGCP